MIVARSNIRATVIPDSAPKVDQKVTVEIVNEDKGWSALPERGRVARRAVGAAIKIARQETGKREVAILFADDARMAALNRAWRGKEGPTNVLSFPAAPVDPVPGAPRPLGDIVLARGVVTAEAASQGKPLASHVSHLIVHGVLHLLGYSHDDDRSAEAMRALETAAQRRLGYPDPYDAEPPARRRERNR